MKQRDDPVPVQRTLTRAHLAFYRAVVEGIDLRRAWGQYLGPATEYSESVASATMVWLRQALAAEAIAAGRPELVGLFRREPRRVGGARRPTLDEFAACYRDAAEFSEAELLAMWQEEFGTPARASPEERRARLSRRLREALQLLERSVPRTPRPDDSVAQWLAPAVARRLVAAGLPRLSDLQAALAARRRQRWEGVPGLGPVWADRLSAWLRSSGLPPTASPPCPAPASRLQPIEAWPSDRLAAPEVQAVQGWLEAHARSTHTWRAYRKAAERLLLWCEHERRTSLCSLTAADGLHYLSWLQTLGGLSVDEWAGRGWRLPQGEWIGAKGAARGTAGWRPFALGVTALRSWQSQASRGERPAPVLGAASVDQELRALRALFRWLRKQQWVTVDPWPGRPLRAAPDPRARTLGGDVWRWVIGRAEAGAGERPARLAAVLWLGLGCGLRASELLALSTRSLQVDGDAWRLIVRGRGGRERTVPLPRPARLAVLRYLATVGVGVEAIGAGAPELPLLRGRRGRRRADGSRPPQGPWGYQSLHGELKRHFIACASELEAHGDPASAVRLRQASTHWLRHSCAVLGLDSGVLDVPSVRALLGHAAPASSLAYAMAPADLAGRVDRWAEIVGGGGGTVPPL